MRQLTVLKDVEHNVMTVHKSPFVLPAVHLIACIATTLGFWFPPLQFLGIGWTFIMLADLPISLLAYVVGWKHSLFAMTWIFTIGTLWWYMLNRVVLHLFCTAKE